MVGRLLDDDPETAYLHAAKAQAWPHASGPCARSFGLAAYRTGRWARHSPSCARPGGWAGTRTCCR